VPAGSYSLTAVATDDAGTATTSAAVSVTVSAAVAQMYFIHPDHLNTPRAVADAGGTVVWRWDQTEPFGDSVPNGEPSGFGAFEFNLRFPGQYADRETASFYNYYRDYDPGTGRYTRSDPIGLEGGINTYAYASGDPVRFFDPDGLEVRFICRPVQGTRGRYSHCFVHVTCPPEQIDVTLSLFGRLPYVSATGHKSMATPRTYAETPSYPDNASSPDNNFNAAVTPKGNNCNCAYEKSVIAKFNAAPATQPYYAFSNNSNTFAQNLVTSPAFGTVVPSGIPQNAPAIYPSAVGVIR
jgi:RHS repeat-associated protein